MLMVGLLYGANYSMLKIVTPEYIGAFGFIVVRVVIATIAFWMVGFFIRERIDWKQDGGRIFLCALFGVGINMLFFFKGLSLTTAINGSIIMTLTPIMVFVMSLLLLKEKVRAYKVVGLLLGLSGAFLIIYREDTGTYQGNWLGDLLVFLNALSYGAYLVLVKPLLAKYQPLTIAKWMFLIGVFLVMPVGWGELMDIPWAAMPAKVYFSMAYVILGVTVLVYIINIWAMKRVSPSTVGAYIYVQPVFATLIASIFFGEVLTLKHLVAALLVFIGVWLVVSRR